MTTIFHPPSVNPHVTLEDISQHICMTVTDILKTLQNVQIGMASGSINADGPVYKKRNIKKLIAFTQFLEKRVSFPVFCASYFFTDNVYKHFERQNITYDDYMLFWRKILLSGIVTDLFMMSGWERSQGAQDEYETAKKCNIVIHIESA